MKKKIIETLDRKEKVLHEVLNLQKIESKMNILKDLDKNVVEITAQIAVLRFLLSE